ncbi:MAG: YlxM family DNA-binding protein [Bacillota bacterium]
MDTLEKHIEINALLDLYEPLLTAKQAKTANYYYKDNYSLQEIAEIEGVSRNAVHDLLKKTVAKLYDYEAKLHLKKKNDKRRELIESIQAKVDDTPVLELLDALWKVE